MIKIALFAGLVAICTCAKLEGHQNVIPILRDDRQTPEFGSYRTSFETGNGIVVEESGSPGSVGQTNVQGSYSYTAPDGQLVEVRYVADEGGFRAESPFIPTAHPLPAHAIEQIRIAEEQRAQGIVWE